VADWPGLVADLLAPLPLLPPRHLLTDARFGLLAGLPAHLLGNLAFRGERARALFAGISAHSILPLEWLGSAAFGLALGLLGHAQGWPLIRGGSQVLADLMAAHLRALRGQIVTGGRVKSLDELPRARAILFDLTPRQLLQIAGQRFSPGYRGKLERFRYGAGAFKIDYALSQPVPWRASGVSRAGTVHLGGSLAEIARAEAEVGRGRIPENPYVIAVQPSLFDRSRAPAGGQTLWVYPHVPNGSRVNMTARIEAQIERYAPGFRDCILARGERSPAAREQYNPNYIGGDSIGGAQDLRQMFARPVLQANPSRTPARGIYLCTSSTPPGGGVHGMCGYHAAQSILADWRKGR